MELNYFKDKIFDILNENDKIGISDIDMNDRKNLLTICMTDGSIFEIVCQQVADKKQGEKLIKK